MNEKKKSISIASRKAKGRNLQNWVAKKISDTLNIPCGKDELIQGREMSQSGTDIKLYGEAKKKFPFSCECKCQETFSIPAWVQQAKENKTKDTDWLLFCTKNRFDKIVIMDANVFFDIWKKVINERIK